MLKLELNSRRWSKSEQEPSSQSAASLATHWDGYPASLGLDLLRCDKSIEAVVEAHTVDAADPQVIETLIPERVEKLAQKHQLSVQEIKAGKRRGSVICADDFVIADIRTHRDLAEFQYEMHDNAVYFRPLEGWWPEALRKAAEFQRLTAKEVASSWAE